MELTIKISDVAQECIQREADRKQISLEDLIGIIINAWCVQQFVMHIRTGGE